MSLIILSIPFFPFTSKCVSCRTGDDNVKKNRFPVNTKWHQEGLKVDTNLSRNLFLNVTCLRCDPAGSPFRISGICSAGEDPKAGYRTYTAP